MRKTTKKTKSIDSQLKRTLADYQNLLKRTVVEKQQYIKFANASLLDKLLSIVDNLEIADSNLKDAGLKIILGQFQSFLETEGVAEIKALDAAFDPQTMDCAEIVTGPKDKIIKIVQKGYTLHDRVLRPAKVTVGKGGK